MLTAGGAGLVIARDVQTEIGGTAILHGASLELSAGELVAVVGPNGAGKSTFVRTIAGLLPACGGSISWNGTELGELKRRQLALMRAFVPQRASVPAGLSVREAVAIGRSPHIGPLRRPTELDREAVEAAMRRTQVTEFGDRMLTTLSGGELQRVQIAVGLAQQASVLIADEPTSHLDLGAAVAVGRLLRELADDGLAVVLVAHDLSLASAVADRVVVMSKGRTVADGPPSEVLNRERLAHVWAVDASLARDGERTALQVDWLGTR